MKKTNLFAALVLSSTMTAIAAPSQVTKKGPSYAVASELYNEFIKTLGSSLLWEKRSAAERQQAVRAAVAHQERIEKVMGGQSYCAKAANLHVVYVTDLNTLVSGAQGTTTVSKFKVLGSLSNAEQFGNARAACYDEVEELDVAK